MVNILTKDEILQADDLLQEEVPVPEWKEDGIVLARGLTAEEKEEFEDSLLSKGVDPEKLIDMNEQERVKFFVKQV